MPMEKGMSIEMGKGMTMSDHRGGHLYMQTNEVKNAIIHSQRWNVSPPPVQVRGLSSRSAVRRARPTPLKARVASSSHQIASFCLPRTEGTIRCPASPWATTASSG